MVNDCKYRHPSSKERRHVGKKEEAETESILLHLSAMPKEENQDRREKNKYQSPISMKRTFFRRIQIPFPYHFPQHAHSSFLGRIIGMMYGFEKRWHQVLFQITIQGHSGRYFNWGTENCSGYNHLHILRNFSKWCIWKSWKDIVTNVFFRIFSSLIATMTTLI